MKHGVQSVAQQRTKTSTFLKFDILFQKKQMMFCWKKRVTCSSIQLLVGIEDNISFFIWLELARFCCPRPQADGNRSFKGQTKLRLYSSPVYKIFVINRQFFQNCFIPLTTIFTFVKSENLDDVIYYTFVIVTTKCRDFLKQWK